MLHLTDLQQTIVTVIFIVATLWIALSDFIVILAAFLGRQFLCRFGRHTKPCGYGVDACGRNCGFTHNPAAMRRWRVTLRSGEVFEVQAINEYHAGSKVVYGDVVSGIQIVDGKVVAPQIKVHRENIEHVQLIT